MEFKALCMAESIIILERFRKVPQNQRQCATRKRNFKKLNLGIGSYNNCAKYVTYRVSRLDEFTCVEQMAKYLKDSYLCRTEGQLTV